MSAFVTEINLLIQPHVHSTMQVFQSSQSSFAFVLEELALNLPSTDEQCCPYALYQVLIEKKLT